LISRAVANPAGHPSQTNEPTPPNRDACHKLLYPVHAYAPTSDVTTRCVLILAASPVNEYDVPFPYTTRAVSTVASYPVNVNEAAPLARVVV
jgi:hypothetical protein